MNKAIKTYQQITTGIQLYLAYFFGMSICVANKRVLAPTNEL